MKFDFKYVRILEHLPTRTIALKDPVRFIQRYENGAIFDEIQRAPELLSYLQVLVDEQKKEGLFILTGSHQLRLQEAVSQSLAGRTAILKLLPLSLSESYQDGNILFSLLYSLIFIFKKTKKIQWIHGANFLFCLMLIFIMFPWLGENL